MNASFKENLDKIYQKYLNHTDPKRFKPISYKDGDFLIHEGEIMDCLYFVLCGKTKVFRTYENGKTLLLRIYDDFTILGDLEYFVERTRTAQCSVQTDDGFVAIKVPYDYIDKEYKRDPDFLTNVLVHTASKILLTNDQTSFHIIYSLDTRLASYLLSFKKDNSKFLRIPKLTDVADNLGTSYRHLTRTIKKLTDEGAIMKIGKEIKIINLHLLEKISKGNVYERQADHYIEG